MQDTTENRKLFASLMGELGLAFRVDASKEMMAVYWKHLHDRSMYQVGHAITDIIRSGDRFPTVARIRELAGSYREFKTREITEPARQITEFKASDYQMPEGDDWFEKMLGETSEKMAI